MDLQQSQKILLFLLIFFKIVKIFQNYIDTGFFFPRTSKMCINLWRQPAVAAILCDA